mgnify:CR=1 FL=1
MASRFPVVKQTKTTFPAPEENPFWYNLYYLDRIVQIVELDVASRPLVVSRTVVTGLTTLMTLLSLFFLGGATIHDFSFALLAGIVFGTYSSIFVASPILALWPHREQV